eukprot:TRINITY_DN2464_c0_g1_i1.p1 TRINITY_DN2464_c0_g1~~TRINITY_DN2464_c0_g1_i1.p1  ORF type:complete len:382 (+),score=59.99 TRINITY_DN2464_c0_g1_i1:36-1181(+)
MKDASEWDESLKAVKEEEEQEKERLSSQESKDDEEERLWRKRVTGYFCLTMVVVAWVGQSEVTRSLQVDGDGYNKPFFLSWVNHTVAFVMVPIQGWFSRCRGEPFMPPALSKTPWTIVFKAIFLLSVVYLLGDYIWYTALARTSVGVGTALFNTSSVFVYVLSVLFLREKVCPRKVFAVAVATGGVVVFSTIGDSGDGSDEETDMIANLLVVAAAFLYAVYEVYFKTVTEEWEADQISSVNMMVGFIAIVTGLTLWPFIVILDVVPEEIRENFTLPSSEHLPGMAGSSLGAVAFNIFFGLSLALLRPVIVSVGVMTTIPITALTDYLFHDEPFNIYQGLGALMILTAFILLNDDIVAAIKDRWYRGSARGQDTKTDYEEVA